MNTQGQKGLAKLTRGVFLALILILPSAIYIFLTSGKHNFIHLPIVGPQIDSTYYTIPDFAFPNQYGDTVTSKDYRGNIYVANFVFTTCPTICPVMTFNLVKLHTLNLNQNIRTQNVIRDS